MRVCSPATDHTMGLEYYIEKCGAADEVVVEKWCVDMAGDVCCSVCANTLASIGTRVGLMMAVLMATWVIVYDGAEAPFNFLTTTVQALAYLSAVIAGIATKQISKFHAYYALFSSLGFLVPLAAVSLTSSAYLYGGSHPPRGYKVPTVAPKHRKKANKTFNRMLARVTNWTPDTPEPAPAPAREENSLGKEQAYYALERFRRKSKTPGAPAPGPIPITHTHVTPGPVHPPTAGEPKLPLRHQLRHAIRRRRRPSTPNSVDSRTPSEIEKENEEHAKKVAKLRADAEKNRKEGAPRRNAMIIGNLLLVFAWLIVYCIIIFGEGHLFVFVQATCTDPVGTDILVRGCAAFIGVGILVWIVLVLNFFHDPNGKGSLDKLLDRPFSFSRSSRQRHKVMAPFLFSAIIFGVWQGLLWGAYGMASQGTSSLMAVNELKVTFTSILAIAMVIKPIFDLVKAWWKKKVRDLKTADSDEKADAAAKLARSKKRANKRIEEQRTEEARHGAVAASLKEEQERAAKLRWAQQATASKKFRDEHRPPPVGAGESSTTDLHRRTTKGKGKETELLGEEHREHETLRRLEVEERGEGAGKEEHEEGEERRRNSRRDDFGGQRAPMRVERPVDPQVPSLPPIRRVSTLHLPPRQPSPPPHQPSPPPRQTSTHPPPA